MSTPEDEYAVEDFVTRHPWAIQDPLRSQAMAAFDSHIRRHSGLSTAERLQTAALETARTMPETFLAAHDGAGHFALLSPQEQAAFQEVQRHDPRVTPQAYLHHSQRRRLRDMDRKDS
jgi:hypothetical protein